MVRAESIVERDVVSIRWDGMGWDGMKGKRRKSKDEPEVV